MEASTLHLKDYHLHTTTFYIYHVPLAAIVLRSGQSFCSSNVHLYFCLPLSWGYLGIDEKASPQNR